MKILNLLIEKKIYIFCQILLCFILGILFDIYNLGLNAIVFIITLIVLMTVIQILIEIIPRKRFYSEIDELCSNKDIVLSIAQMINKPDFYDGEVIYDTIMKLSKAMNDEIAKYRVAEEEYKEYIETWIHEVKIPLSTINLICDNNDNINNSIMEEVSNIENFVEQALYYARSTNVENDYIVRKVNLDDIIKNAIKKNSKQLIRCNTKLSFENTKKVVCSDSKWLNFIFSQIISNSIKYRNLEKNELNLKFSVIDNITNIILKISDNGIGIPKEDLDRVFEKSFTGNNGRIYGKSTGMGLYICKRLCEKMNHSISIESDIEKGTTIIIIFPFDK